MSATATLIANHLATGTPPLASSGVIDLLTSKVNAVTVLLRGASVLGGMGFVFWQGVASRGALARIIIAGIAAGVFVYLIFNVTTLRDRTDNEVNNSSRPAFSHVISPSPDSPAGPQSGRASAGPVYR